MYFNCLIMFSLHLLTLILVSVLALLALGQVSPHLTNDSSDLPELEFWVFILDLIKTVLALPRGQMKVINIPYPRSFCCISCRASEASPALWEAWEFREPGESSAQPSGG